MSADAPAARPSRLQLPPGPWTTLLDGLCARFPAVSRETWRDRFARGRVQAPNGEALAAAAAYRVGQEIVYFREVVHEPAVPFVETLLHVDEHLVVADKPHFLAVTPGGPYLRETLLARLQQRLGNPDLVPLHRIDRETAGLVMFSACRATRGSYQTLFSARRIHKEYEAIAPALPDRNFPLTRRSRLLEGTPFPRMREADGEPNSETGIDVIARDQHHWRYRLRPVTGRKHQLRVHMAALGAPLLNDRVYADLPPRARDDFRDPLQLLATRLVFEDPLSGDRREFHTRRNL